MVTIIDDPYSGNVFGRIGKGLGQGLSEQLPKEIEKSRLSSALKNLQDNPDMPPLERLRNLYKAGATESQISQIEPYIRNAAIRKRGQQRNEPSVQNLPGQNQMIQGTQQQMPEQGTQGVTQTGMKQPPDNAQTLSTPGSEASARQPLYVPSPQDIENESFRLMELDPNLYDSYEKANQQARVNLSYPAEVQAQNIAAGERQQLQQTRLENDFNKQVGEKLGDPVTGLAKNIPGETLDRIKAKAEADVLRGKSEKNATRDAVSEALEMGKAANNIENNLGTRPFFGKAPKKLIDDLKSAKKPFEKSGELELFKNLQMLYSDIGDHLASFNTWIPNKKLEKDIVEANVKDSSAKIAATITKDITPDDSLFSVGYLLSKTDKDDAAIMNEIQRMQNEGVIDLNARQIRELSTYYPLKPGMGDLLWDSVIGLAGIGGLALEYITGNKKKVGRMQATKQLLGKE